MAYGTPDELSKVIDEYFLMVPEEDWTITGVALAVGSKQLLYDYGERDGYREIVARARAMVEDSYEVDLKRYGRAGTIFALKNFDWKDRNETDVTSKDERIEGLVVYKPEVPNV